MATFNKNKSILTAYIPLNGRPLNLIIAHFHELKTYNFDLKQLHVLVTKSQHFFPPGPRFTKGRKS